MGIDAEMYVTTPYHYSKEELQRWNYTIGDALGKHHGGPVWVTRKDSYTKEHVYPLHDCAEMPYYYHGDEVAAKEEGWEPNVIGQDHMDRSLDVRAKPGEHMLQVRLFTRYYGEGYERGDLWGILATAAWLDQNIPNATVYYGGDSSGVLIEPFGWQERVKLVKHWATVGHEPYNRGFDTDLSGRKIERPICDMCNVPLIRYGWGPDGFGSFSCSGCGLKLVTRDEGVTFKEKDDRAKR